MDNLDPRVRIAGSTLVTQPPDTGMVIIEAYGPAAATKPIDRVASGSTFIEVDTGNFYLFDETAASDKWVLQFCLQAEEDES